MQWENGVQVYEWQVQATERLTLIYSRPPPSEGMAISSMCLKFVRELVWDTLLNVHEVLWLTGATSIGWRILGYCQRIAELNKW